MLRKFDESIGHDLKVGSDRQSILGLHSIFKYYQENKRKLKTQSVPFSVIRLNRFSPVIVQAVPSSTIYLTPLDGI